MNHSLGGRAFRSLTDSSESNITLSSRRLTEIDDKPMDQGVKWLKISQRSANARESFETMPLSRWLPLVSSEEAGWGLSRPLSLGDTQYLTQIGLSLCTDAGRCKRIPNGKTGFGGAARRCV